MADDLRLTQAPGVHAGVLIRRPPTDDSAAFADPAITTKIWFTKSSGRMAPGAELRWEWEMYGAIADLHVREMEPNRRIRFDWDEPARAVEIGLTPWNDATTDVQITEPGFTGNGDQLAAAVADSTGSFTFLVRALEALLEHGWCCGSWRTLVRLGSRL